MDAQNGLTFWCDVCSKEITGTKGAHRKGFHQQEVTLTFEDGNKLKVKRRRADEPLSDSFVCCKCQQFNTRWPHVLQTHALVCLGLPNGFPAVIPAAIPAVVDEVEEVVNEVGVAQPAIFLGDSSELVAHEVLHVLKVGLHRNFGFLSCLRESCGYALSGEWWHHINKHLKAERKGEVTQEQQEAVKGLRDAHPVAPIVPAADLRPIQGLKLRAGLACLKCTGWCSETLPALKEHHYSNHNEGLHHEACYFQFLNFQGKMRNNIRVSVLGLLTSPDSLNFVPSFRCTQSSHP